MRLEITILAQLTGSGATDEPTTVKRISDNRSLDEKIYKLRVVVPSQLTNAKTPESGFVIQESSSTGFRVDSDATAVGIGTTDYDFNRNQESSRVVLSHHQQLPLLQNFHTI